MIKFGDVVRFKETEYVYLAGTDEKIYLARILDERQTQQVKNLYEKKLIDGNKQGKLSNALYCFVILSTDEYRERMAHFAKTEEDFNTQFSETFFDFVCNLNEKDRKEISDEILRDGSAVPLNLQRIFREDTH